MATILANEVDSAGGDITSRKARVQIMFFKGKKCRVFGDIMTQMNKQSEKVKLCVI